VTGGFRGKTVRRIASWTNVKEELSNGKKKREMADSI
jgi:hypothetical protein